LLGRWHGAGKSEGATMDAYIYQAALWCEECAAEIQLEVPVPQGANLEDNDEATWDSDDYPKGPYADGGGEADTPQHCDGCGEFLENPLTEDGHLYVIEAIVEHLANGRGTASVLTEWADEYSISARDLLEQAVPAKA
jgi:hypothetical protein